MLMPLVADGMPLKSMWLMLLPLFLFVKWLMLMPLVADGMPLKFMWLMLLPLDFWLMLLPKLCDVADVITTWQML